MARKLGPHVILLTDQVRPWVEQAPIVKALDDPTPLKLARSAKVMVFRRYFADQDLSRLSPERAVQEILAALSGFNDPRLYVELLNECCQYMWWGFKDYVAWTARAAELLHQAGCKVAGFSFSTGTPRLDTDPGGAEEWLYLKSRGCAGVDAVSIHAYWGSQGFTEWHALRHRRVHAILEPGHPPFIVTECGRDAVEQGLGGWRRDGISAEQYARELLAYEAELLKDDYVLGATVFTSRSFDPTWDPFAVEEVVPFILQARPPAPEPQPPAAAPGQTLWDLFKWAAEAAGGQATLEGFKAWLKENGCDPEGCGGYGYPCADPGPQPAPAPSLYEQWAAERRARGEDPADKAAFMEHLRALWGTPYALKEAGWPGPFTLYDEWAEARAKAGEDPEDKVAFKQFLKEIGADPLRLREAGWLHEATPWEEWAEARVKAGEDPYDLKAFKAHALAVFGTGDALASGWPAPFKVGLWVWYADRADFIEAARRLGADAVLIKAADGARPWAQWGPARDKALAAGLKALPWAYLYGDPAELDVILPIAREAKVFILDLEAEWERQPEAVKLAYIERLRAFKREGITLIVTCFARPGLHGATRCDLLDQVADLWVPMAAWHYWTPAAAGPWFDDWDRAGLRPTSPRLPGCEVAADALRASIAEALDRYGSCSVWDAAHVLDILPAPEPPAEPAPGPEPAAAPAPEPEPVPAPELGPEPAPEPAREPPGRRVLGRLINALLKLIVKILFVGVKK